MPNLGCHRPIGISAAKHVASMNASATPTAAALILTVAKRNGTSIGVAMAGKLALSRSAAPAKAGVQ